MTRLSAGLLAPIFCWSIAAGEPATPPAETTPNTPKPDATKEATKKESAVSHAKAGPHKFTNALSKETSPYLLQHAHNPVNWYPWGPEAFEKAKKEDKPIFLSVGYSSCHWCHVMERESFENENVAAILNEHFISIKVDREERPDVDEIYMTAVQITTQRGGWPMTVFMTSDGRPFFGGTYFPPEDIGGRTGFKTLLSRVDGVWKKQREDVHRDADRLSEIIRAQMATRRVSADGPLDVWLLENGIAQLYENFDTKRGGFGTRPKFPPNNALPTLLHLIEKKTTSDVRATEIATKTLDAMAIGGIHDHLAGGFHRYSTDERWLLPHFEKMLYDNALLSRSYAQASAIFKNPEYARVARGVYDWVLREMTDPAGGFYSTLDADSEGHEGKFYVWDRKEVAGILGADAELFCAVYNIDPNGNFREEATGEETGLNIPHLTKTLAAHAAERKLTEDDLRKKMDECKAKLMTVRVKRIWPGLDDKILTSWNALMIGSFARGSVWLNEPKYKDAAIKAAEFLLKNLRSNGRWLATHRKGESKLAAYLDDHAFLANAFMDLYEATNDKRWVDEARAVVKLMDEHFKDDALGGYFFTADDHEKLLARSKDPTDKAIPSGNGIASQALVRLAVATGDKSYADHAEKLLEEFQGLMEKVPQATESLLLGTALYLEGQPARAAKEEPRDNRKVVEGAVTAEAFVSKSALRRGDNVLVAVRFNIGLGWHIAAAGEQESNLSSTKIALASSGIGQLNQLTYPESKILKSEELGGELKVYDGTVYAGGVLAIKPDAALGKRNLKLRVFAQACNDKICQAPLETVLSIPVEIVEKDAPAAPQHDDVFQNLKLK